MILLYDTFCYQHLSLCRLPTCIKSSALLIRLLGLVYVMQLLIGVRIILNNYALLLLLVIIFIFRNAHITTIYISQEDKYYDLGEAIVQGKMFYVILSQNKIC